MPEPWYTTPQSYAPLSVQMRDSLEMEQPDIFDGIDIMGLLSEMRQSGGAPEIEERSMPIPQAEPEPSLNWRQRIANNVAGERFPDSTQEDRDAAFRRGMGSLGDVLLAAALAPDARSRARVLAQALPQAGSAYREELGGIVSARDEQEKRAYEKERRARENERHEYEMGQRARTLDDQRREDAERNALSGSGAEWRAQFDRYVNDADVNENKRGALSSEFNAAIAKFEANPSPKNADAVLAALSGAASAANEYESLVEEVSQEMQKESLRTKIPVEKLASMLGEKKIREGVLQNLQIENARRSGANEARRSAEAERDAELERKVLDAFLAGKPLTTPDGHTLLPDTRGVSIARPPRVSQPRMSELDKEILKNKDIRAIAGSETMAESISPETAGLIRRWIPDIQFETGDDGSIVMPANERVKFLEQWQSAASNPTVANNATVAPGGGSPPPIVQPKQIPRSMVEALMTEQGISYDDAVRQIEDRLKKPVIVN